MAFSVTGSITVADVRDGDQGSRGAGWWRYETGSSAATTGLSNTTLNTYFDTATGGLSVIEGDRLIVANTAGDATGYLRNNANTSWVEQANFLDGDLLVSGTVTTNAIDTGAINADKIDANSITADKIQSGSINADLLDLDGPLVMDDPTSAILGGRTSLSDFGTEGFYIGRTSSNGTTADGFQLSHTSQNANGDVQGIVHDSQQFSIFEPTFRTKTDITTANTALTTNGQTYTLAKGQTHTINIIGGGGGGGGASGEDSAKAGIYHGTAGGAGTATVVNLTGASGYTGTTSWSASGGAGGLRGEDDTDHWTSGSDSIPAADSGGNSTYGDGGAGGSGQDVTHSGGNQNGYNGSSPAATAYGAGGGGGSSGFNDKSNEGWWGNAGGGGGSAQVLTVTIDLTSATTDGTLTLTSVGSGGAGGGGYDIGGATAGDGAAGAGGALVIVSELDGYTSLSIEDMRFAFLIPDDDVSTTSITDHGTQHTFFGPFTNDRYIQLSGSFYGGYSWNASDIWNLTFYSTSSTQNALVNVFSASGGDASSTNVTGTTSPSVGAAGSNGRFVSYSTLDRQYKVITFSVTAFLPAGVEIRQVGEWNGATPYALNIIGGSWDA